MPTSTAARLNAKRARRQRAIVAPSWLLLLQLSLLALDLPLDVGAAAKQGDPDREYDDQQEA